MTRTQKPYIVSFYAGDRYYYDAAERLREDCERLGVPHSIVELQVPADFNWGQICRKKVEFYLDRVETLDAPVIWVDVDSSLLSAPDVLEGCRFDMAGYSRHNRYIRDYDRYFSSRFWMPQVMFFNNTERAKRFLRHLVAVERASDTFGSDDYFMEEAWQTFGEQMSVGFLPPQTLALRESEINPETIVCFRASGNVKEFAKSMEQHVPPYKTPFFKKKVFEAAAIDAQQAGDRVDAANLMERAFSVDRTDETIAMKTAELLRSVGRQPDALRVLETHHEASPGTGAALKRITSFALDSGDLDTADAALARLRALPAEGAREFAESRAFRVDLERRAASMPIQQSDRVSVWWMESPYPGNFGDVLNPYLIERITGVPPKFAPRNRGLLAIGSVIKFATNRSVVWGSGTPRMTDALAPGATYTAVRGPLSQELVRASGGRCPDVTGDPALLLPRFYTPKSSKAYRLGVIPHVCHLDQGIEVADDVLLISPLLVGYDAIERFIDQIASCEAIISSSLHGIIVANAYGVPTQWCHFGEGSPELAGDGTKFEDYFRSVGLPVQTALDITALGRIEAKHASLVDRELDMRFDADALLAAFPGKRMPWAAHATTPESAAQLVDAMTWRSVLALGASLPAGSTHERSVVADSLARRVVANPASLRIFLREIIDRNDTLLLDELARRVALTLPSYLVCEIGVLEKRGATDPAARLKAAFN